MGEGITAPLSKKPLNWLPAHELYGEGIFIRLNEEKVSEWEIKNALRYKNLISRAKGTYLANNKVSGGNVRYILLHTLAHLIIRELTLRCGYTSASIKEKIYSSEDNEKQMCGILVYTASSDSDGSLGGVSKTRSSRKDARDILAYARERKLVFKRSCLYRFPEPRVRGIKLCCLPCLLLVARNQL